MIRQSLARTAAAIRTAVACGLLLQVSAGQAADIKVLSAPPLRTVMSELLPLFEKSTGHRVTIEYATVGPLVDRFLKGEPADVLIVTKQPIASLQQQGKILSGSAADIAKVGMG